MSAELKDPPATSTRGSIGVAIVEPRRLIAAALAALVGAIEDVFVTDLISESQPAWRSLAAAELVLVGIGSENAPAFEFVRSLGARPPRPKVVMVADALAPDLIRFVLEERCNGLILTDTAPADFAACLAQVAHGQAVLPADWHIALSRERDDPLQALSRRQLEVLSLLAEGASHEEIGARLFISCNTVKFHLRSIYLRLGVNNRMAAARLLSQSPGRR